MAALAILLEYVHDDFATATTQFTVEQPASCECVHSICIYRW